MCLSSSSWSLPKTDCLMSPHFHVTDLDVVFLHGPETKFDAVVQNVVFKLQVSPPPPPQTVSMNSLNSYASSNQSSRFFASRRFSWNSCAFFRVCALLVTTRLTLEIYYGLASVFGRYALWFCRSVPAFRRYLCSINKPTAHGHDNF